MSSPGDGGRRRPSTSRQYSAEDQALNQIAREAESRLAARRAARAEAREVRVRELERQQKEQEEKEKSEGGGPTDLKTSSSSSRFLSNAVTSRRGSNDSGSTGDEASTRELKREVAELEEKYRKSMLNNAQLDTEKQTFRYQVELSKDQLDDLKEQLVELSRLHKDKCRELEHKKRDYSDLQGECDFLKEQLQLRDELIEQYGLVYISNDTVEDGDEKDDKVKRKKKDGEKNGTIGLVTPEAAQILDKHQGNLDERLKKFSESQTSLQEENKKLKQQLEEEKERSNLAEKYASPAKSAKVNGPDVQVLELQIEAQKQLNDYKFRLKKAEQEITTFEGNVIRLESQVKRYRTAAENSEKAEDDLKAEKRKLQREVREAQANIEELTTQNHHLQKRLEKLKSRPPIH